ncbi:hypothetical protein [Streptomyces sp. SJL17-1]|uniref:hypothetical protein n=1 Tax=Streptomyces sp. SJL17-1 TaxID=2967223 RepID=UPI0029673CED|nr:hypothetical protein [Streptomyces sp. SJL17-1]
MGGVKTKITAKSEPSWREVGWEWRRPRALEVTGAASTLPVAAMLGGYLPEGPMIQMAAVAIAVNTVIDLATKCVRRPGR